MFYDFWFFFFYIRSSTAGRCGVRWTGVHKRARNSSRQPSTEQSAAAVINVTADRDWVPQSPPHPAADHQLQYPRVLGPRRRRRRQQAPPARRDHQCRRHYPGSVGFSRISTADSVAFHGPHSRCVHIILVIVKVPWKSSILLSRMRHNCYCQYRIVVVR